MKRNVEPKQKGLDNIQNDIFTVLKQRPFEIEEIKNGRCKIYSWKNFSAEEQDYIRRQYVGKYIPFSKLDIYNDSLNYNLYIFSEPDKLEKDKYIYISDIMLNASEIEDLHHYISEHQEKFYI